MVIDKMLNMYTSRCTATQTRTHFEESVGPNAHASQGHVNLFQVIIKEGGRDGEVERRGQVGGVCMIVTYILNLVFNEDGKRVLRIAQITDPHLGAFMSKERLNDILFINNLWKN